MPISNQTIHKILTYCIAAVWLVNGLFCKILNFVPRHQAIVARIVSVEYAQYLTIAIGFSEIIMAFWVLSKIKTRFNAIAQMLIVGTMNVLEFSLVPDLLLWGKLNAFFALCFILVVYFNEFYFNKKIGQQT